MRRISGDPKPQTRPELTPETPAERERRLWPDAPRVTPLRLREIPLLTAAVCFALGIAAQKLTLPVSRPTPLLLLGALGLTAITFAALARSARIAFAPVCALWCCAGLWCAQIEPYPPPQTELLAYSDGLSRTIQAHVIRISELPPRTSEQTDDLDHDFDGDESENAGDVTYSLDLALTSIENVTPDVSRMVPISGGVRATVTGDRLNAALRCGDTIEAPIRLHLPQRFRDPGVFQYADYMLTQDADGIAATTTIQPGKLRRLDAPPPFTGTMRCRIHGMQTWAAARLSSYVHSLPNRGVPRLLRLAPEDAATLNAMLFGDRTRLTHELRLGFERTGSFHLFVVSGMHLGLLAAALIWLGERLRLPQWLVSVLTLLVASVYALLTGFGVPVQRALLMTAVFLFARLLFRERVALNALGAAALAVLAASPRALFETSFQMTFLALVAIAGIATPLARHRLVPWSYAARGLDLHWKNSALPPRLAQLRVMLSLWGDLFADAFGALAAPVPGSMLRILLWSAELALVGVVAEAVMILPMSLYFHRATVFALPANMISIPLVAAIASLGLATFVLSLFSPWLAVIPASFTAMLLHLITFGIHAIATTRAADIRVPGPVLWRSACALLCIGLCCWFARRPRYWAAAPAALLVAAGLFVLWPQRPIVDRNTLEVTAIDVGQGDSLLLVDPGGNTMLIDAGGPTGAAARAENASGTPAFDVGEQVVSPYLWSRQIRAIDVLVLSHAHSDHMGGMPAVLRNFRPRELWVGIDPASEAYRNLLAEAALYGTTVRHLHASDTLAWHDAAVTVLAPAPGYTNSGPPANNDSLVLRVQYDRASVLLEGDAEAASEHAMLDGASRNPALALGPVTLLKVAHHGSRTSTTAALLSAAAPQDAIISVGRGNTFGHPRAEILARLAEAHTHVFRTDEFGMTTFRLSRDGTISAATAASNP